MQVNDQNQVLLEIVTIKKKKSLTFQKKWTFLEINTKIPCKKRLGNWSTEWENRLKSAARKSMAQNSELHPS